MGSAPLAGEMLLEEEIARIAWVSREDIEEGWVYFRE
jgi:hypothetical protein